MTRSIGKANGKRPFLSTSSECFAVAINNTTNLIILQNWIISGLFFLQMWTQGESPSSLNSVNNILLIEQIQIEYWHYAAPHVNLFTRSCSVQQCMYRLSFTVITNTHDSKISFINHSCEFKIGPFMFNHY